MKSAKLTIDIWADDKESLHVEPEDLPGEFVQHLEHVRNLSEQGCTSGDICGEHYRGWWKIETED